MESSGPSEPTRRRSARLAAAGRPEGSADGPAEGYEPSLAGTEAAVSDGACPQTNAKIASATEKWSLSDTLRLFARRLFVLTATVKQETGSAASGDPEYITAQRVRLLKSVQLVSSDELSRLGSVCMTDSEHSSDVREVVKLLTRLQTTAGTAKDWAQDDVERLGHRICTAHMLLETGFSRYLRYLRLCDIPAAISEYQEAKFKPDGPRQLQDVKQATPPCIRTEMRFTPGASGAASKGKSEIVCRKKRPRTGLGSDFSTTSEWESVFDLVGPNLESKLSLQSKSRVRLTSSTWRRKLDSEQTSLTPLGTTRTQRLVTLFPSVTSLDLSSGNGEQLLPDDLIKLCTAYGKQLASLTLCHNAVESIHLPFFSRFSCLKQLDLSRCALLSPDSIAALPLLLSPTVASLSLAYCAHMDDTGLEKFALAADQATQLSADGDAGAVARSQASLPNKLAFGVSHQPLAPNKLSLTELDLSGCPKITCAGVVHLSTSVVAKTLEVLRLRECSLLAGEGVRAIVKSMKGLKELDISGNNNMSDIVLGEVVALDGLEHLSVGGNNMTGSWLSGLSKLTNLRSLSLRACTAITEHAFGINFPEQQEEPVLAKLESMDLSYCSEIGSHSTWTCLSALPSLTSLDMSYTSTSNSQLKNWVRQMSKLTSLSLEGCGGVSDTGMEPFFSHPSLKSLKLCGCGSIGYYAVTALEMAGIDFGV